MEAAKNISIPPDFKYRDVLLKGKPAHERFDAFCRRHPRMDVGKRAKLFAPFAALSSLDEALASKQVPYVARAELSAEDARRLSRQLALLHRLTCNGRMARKHRVSVRVTFFVPCADVRHSAFGVLGQYRTVTGLCRSVDPDVGHSLCVDNVPIAFEDIARIEFSKGLRF